MLICRVFSIGRFLTTLLYWKGMFDMLDSLVPSKLAMRQVVSKVGSVFDLRGLLAPVLETLRLDSIRTAKAVGTWDEAVPADLRQKWAKNF